MENKNSVIVNFGKYNGKSVSDIAKEDINYLIWLANNYNVFSFSSPNPYSRLKQSTLDYRYQLKQEAKELVESYFKKIEESNRQNSTEKHIGVLGKRMVLEITINSIKIKDGYSIIIANDTEGNIIRFYDKGFGLQPGQKITISGNPQKHIEILGKNQTYFNRVKISTTTK